MSKKTKRVVRFYFHSWLDIVVETKANAQEDELIEAAKAKYDNGEYSLSDIEHEDEGAKEVTEHYRQNNIPF